jgi:hypothetical protein
MSARRWKKRRRQRTILRRYGGNRAADIASVVVTRARAYKQYEYPEIEIAKIRNEPNAPKKRLGPSPAWAWGLVRAVDGMTVSSATRSWSITDGAKKANNDRNSAVNMSTGAK